MPPEAALAPLQRVVAKYRRDVHQLSNAAPAESVGVLEGHLGQCLPAGLRSFLLVHNGASLFRGALRIRSVADIAPASEEHRNIVLFADGPIPAAFTREANGNVVLGTWDGKQLTPLHTSFAGWFAATVDILDTRVTTERDRELLSFAADDEDVFQLMRAGERALRTGRPDEAVPLLQKALDHDDSQVGAWHLLGDALIGSDRSAARLAWREAFRRCSLPLAWPGAPCLDADILSPLADAYKEPEAWVRELERFLGDRVKDVTTHEGAVLVEAVVHHLAKAQLKRGRRASARDAYRGLLSRQPLFTWSDPAWKTHLEVARLEMDLGNHDEAEALLRRVISDGPDTLRGRALLLTAGIATVRHEPWAEELLAEAHAAGLDRTDAIEHALLATERAVRTEREDVARRWLERVNTLVEAFGTRFDAVRLLAEGEVRRLGGHGNEAADLWRQAILETRPNPETKGRLHLRLGDHILPTDADAAHEHYRQALDLFVGVELPLREAWTLVRLSRLHSKDAQLLQAARDRFATADLASGMAAVDVAMGIPGHNLAWHLERATRHARSRHDAQRNRPPWTRADAERPERRLGAHRTALAACGPGVVGAIAREMDACVRAMRSGRARTLDPPVMRYVAAADLLSAHRSYEAARVLLDQLMARFVEGPAHRSLQGAIARSPNMALVDRLLVVVEEHAKHPAQSVAEAAEILGLRRESASVEVLTKLIGATAHPVIRKAAVTALGRIGERSVVDALAKALDEPALAEPAALSLLMLGDRRGIDFHGRALSGDRADMTGSPGEIVGRYGGPSYLLLLRNVAQENDASGLGALQGLGLMGDPRAVPVLLGALSGRPRAVSEVANDALTILTGHIEDLDDPGARNRWAQWWQTHADQFREGLRHRSGRPMDGSLLLTRMDNDLPWTRRTAYDELVITTGARLPFDAEGPWRAQRTHVRSWRSWWNENRTRFPAGGWYLDGDRIG